MDAHDAVWLTQSRLQSLLDYAPESGLFVWRANPAMRTQWNGRYPGKEAGALTSNGYVRVRIRKHDFRAHRLAWLYVHGQWPTNEIDHRNGVRTDNRICNLREATVAENRRNKVGNLNNPNPKGVTYHKKNRRWLAAIHLNGKTTHLGCFDSSAEAHAAYHDAAVKHFGAFARAG